MAAGAPQTFDYLTAASRLVQLLSPMTLPGLGMAVVFAPFRLDLGPLQIGTAPGLVSLTGSVRFDALHLSPANHPDRYVPIHAAVQTLQNELAREVSRRLRSAPGITAVCERSTVSWAPLPTPDGQPGEPGDPVLSIDVRVQSLDRQG